MMRLLLKKDDGDVVPNTRIRVRDGIYLGGYHTGDRESLAIYLNDLSIYKNTLNVPHPYTLKDATWWIDHVVREKRRLGIQPNWTIRNVDNELIGGIGMVVNGPAIEPVQEIGYWLAKPYRGQGIMVDAILALTNHCFKKYKRIETFSAHIFHHNEASMITAKKAGFTMIRLIDDYYEKGDSKIYAIDFVLYRKDKHKSKRRLMSMNG